MKLQLRTLKTVINRFKRLWSRWHPPRDMTEDDEEHLKKHLNFSHMAAANNLRMMSRFTTESRERFSRKTKSLVLYTPEEARLVKKLEEDAALRAAPQNYELKELNGINIGCGNRRIIEFLTPIDIMRESHGEEASGAHHAFLRDAILANPEDLPFKSESLDYIVALHMLEHVSNPAQILAYWATLLKPGGGIGLILPNYEYTWDAAGDDSKYGHKWNASEAVFVKLYDAYLKDDLILEKIGTLPHKISFDVILRKPGQFGPFAISNSTCQHSGAELARMGTMVSDFAH